LPEADSGPYSDGLIAAMDQALDILARLGPWVYPLLFAYAAIKSGYLPLAPARTSIRVGGEQFG